MKNCNEKKSDYCDCNFREHCEAKPVIDKRELLMLGTIALIDFLLIILLFTI